LPSNKREVEFDDHKLWEEMVMTRHRVGAILVLVVLTALVGFGELRNYRSSPSQNPGHSSDLNELRARFNRDKGKVRLLLLLSPTCRGCLRGASEVQSKVLDKIKDPDLRVYVVYLPILAGDQERSVPSATKQIPDGRVSYFWDGKGELGQVYSRVLQIPEGKTAWDVYLAFDSNPEWKESAPVPNYWQHQLWALWDVAPERRFDADKLAGEVKKLLQPGTH
jgi:hypothetical protein